MTNREFEKPRSRPSGAMPRKGRAPRVFLGPVEIAGYYTALGLGLRGIGIAATAVDLTDHPFRYGGDSTKAPRLASLAILARRRQASSGFSAGLWRIAAQVVKVSLFIWALMRFDVFVFGFGETFFRLRDLPILKFCGKRIIMVFHGSDLRPPYMDGPTIGGSSSRSISDCAHLAQRLKSRARTVERYCDVVVSHSLYSHFLERPYVRFLAIGLPVQLPPIESETRTGAGSGIRVLHSPSDPTVKGTLAVREAVRQVTAQGVPIEYVEVSGQPNATVLRELQMADVVIDQLYSDTPMAGFAAEAATVGRPVIVGSCDWDEIRRAVPAHEAGPVQPCDAEHLVEALRILATDATARRDLGDRARSFALDRCDPTQVARRFESIIRDRIPSDWYSDPSDCRHLCGAGVPPERVQSVVRELVARHGRESLQLGDKPVLEAQLVAWATSSPGLA